MGGWYFLIDNLSLKNLNFFRCKKEKKNSLYFCILKASKSNCLNTNFTELPRLIFGPNSYFCVEMVLLELKTASMSKFAESRKCRNGMQTIILTFKDVLKIHSILIFISYIFMFTNLFSLQYKEDHFVKFKTLSQLSPLLLHVSYYNFGIFWKVSTFD